MTDSGLASSRFGSRRTVNPYSRNGCFPLAAASSVTFSNVDRWKLGEGLFLG